MNPCQIEACQGKPVCAECRKLNYCPATIQRQQIAALQTVTVQVGS